MSVALVLGAGGASGTAFLASALTVLDVDLGWDARDADLIVGTSAGAVVGALLRSGLSPYDITALLQDAPASADHPHVRDGRVDRPRLPPLSPWDLVTRPRRPPVGRWLLRPTSVTARHLAAGFVGDGHLDLMPLFDRMRHLLPEWPERPLWLCAAHYGTLERVVFGNGAGPVPPTHPVDAVAASCAVPGIFTPVHIGDSRYVDGGVHSPTNADLLASVDDLEAVVVVSPLTGAARAPGFRWAMRRYITRVLGRELASLRDDVAVLILEPPSEVSRHLSIDPTCEPPAQEVLRASFLTAGDWLHGVAAETVLDRLRAAGRRAR